MKRKAKGGASRLDLQQGMTFVLNPYLSRPDSRKRCKGCSLRSAQEWCQYRIWAKESSKGYRFKLYNQYGGKIKEQLPICKHPEMSKKPVPKPSRWAKIQKASL